MYEVKVESPSQSAGLKYIRANCNKIKGKPGFYQVHTALKVFKKAHTLDEGDICIISLEIPVGAIVYAPSFREHSGYQDDRKMRASEARIESILEINAEINLWKTSYRTIRVEKSKPVKTAYSFHDWSFKYRTNKIVIPKSAFSYEPDQCESGIHFFVNPVDAITY